jgi:hypothetical protein
MLHEIDRERDEEQFLAAKPIGQPTEEKCSEHGACKIGAAGDSNIGIGEVQACFQSAGQTSGERHFQPIQNPGDAQGGHHQRVEAAPRQSVEPRRNIGFDDLLVLHHERNVNAVGPVNLARWIERLKGGRGSQNRP